MLWVGEWDVVVVSVMVLPVLAQVLPAARSVEAVSPS